MQAFTVLGDPTRRRILELLAAGESTSGVICEAIQSETAISQPAVSQHLKVLREGGLVDVRVDGNRRLYSVNAQPLQEIEEWLHQFKRSWVPHLMALETEVARGKRERRQRKASRERPERKTS